MITDPGSWEGWMNCPRCQAQNDEGARFCEECGIRLELACPSCGQPVGVGKKFCRSCGASLTSESDAFASPQAYTPRHLAEKILTSKAALEGERKQITVLFADMKGSMELLADRDPEQARKILDPVLERMMEAVHRYEGTVNQVMGDGIMALFGAPVAHEDHAIRACYAALRMQEAVKRYAEDVRRSEGILPQIRVGLNSGEVVVRSIGSDLHMDYTAVGQTTHLAARMEQMAAAGSILMAADTLRLTEGYVQVKPVGPVRVKGLGEAVEVYEVTGAGPVRTRLQATATRGLTRFVGRTAELEQLQQSLEGAAQGYGQVVALVGEPGVGKSRLFHELTRSHRTQGWMVLESGAVSYGKATAYLPVIGLLKAYYQIEGRDDTRKIREKVTGKLLALDRSLEPFLPALLSLLDVAVEEPQWERLDPPRRRQRTLDGIKRLLLRESQVQPVVTVFEDLHWIDSETQALLDSLVESLPTARLLLLVNYRPEYQHGWSGKTYYRQLRIDPLPPATAEELLRGLLGDAPELRPLERLLTDRTEGNPFFLEETVRTLVETRVLVGERGAYRLAKEVGTIRVAPTVQAVLAARIDRLTPEEKRLLQTAAVIGKDVPFALLQAIAGAPEDALRRSLANLQASEFLYESKLFPDLEYTFKHALTHEVAYGSLLQERRRALHARIVEAIEHFDSARLSEHVEQLAHHALHGEVWDKALTYLRQAGAKAAARSAYRESAAYLTQALRTLEHLPQSPALMAEAVDLRLELRNSLAPLGQYAAVLEHLEGARTIAEALGDQGRLGLVFAHLANYFAPLGHHQRAIAAGERALAIASELGDSTLQTVANFRLAQSYYLLGDFRRMLTLLQSVVALLESNPKAERFGTPFFLSVGSRSWLGRCLGEMGQFSEGEGVALEGLRRAEDLDHPLSVVIACFGLGRVYLLQGVLPKALATLERGLQLARSLAFDAWLPLSAAQLGHAYTLAGRPADGIPLLEECVRIQTSRNRLQELALTLTWLAGAYLRSGRSEDTMAAAGDALRLARERGERGNEGWVMWVLGEITCHRAPGDVGEAEAHYLEAGARGTELGMRPLVAHCRFGLGKLYRRAGKREPAREHLATATTAFREMGMQFWLEKAETELKELC